MNTSFHNLIKNAAIEFARTNAIVMPGDYVTTLWGGWKKPRRVQIYAVGAALAHSDVDPIKHEFRAVLEMTYYALRLNKKGDSREKTGVGIVLKNFITEDGQKWEQSAKLINNATVHWKIPESWPYNPETGRIERR